MTSSSRPDLTLYQRDQQNTGHHHRGSSQRAETLRQATSNQDLPAPMGWSTSAQPVDPLQSGPAQQGTPTRHQQNGFAHPEDGFSGGFVLPDNSNGVSTPPTALTPPSSVFPLPSNSSQQVPPVVPPTVDDDEYVHFPFPSFLLLISFHMEMLCLVYSRGPR